MAGTIKRVRERLVYENAYVRVYDDDVVFPGGSSGNYLRIVHAGDGVGAVIIARHAGTYALVRTYRYSIDAHQWAFPRGFSHGADVEETVRAELREELGGEAEDVQILGFLTPDSGLLASKVAVALVDVTTPAATPEDLEEVEEVEWVSYDELSRRLREGAIDDGFTLAAWAMLTLAERS
jgi:8-oxo-dGTP pyrophosphatase MutT (NUDIX family)